VQRTLSVFKTFLKFGCFTFGGGWSIVAQMQKEYVEDKGWITDEELLDFTSVARSTPGLMIGNTSVLFGYHAAGIPGALAALLGMVIPPIIVMLGVVVLYDQVKDNLYVSRAMVGVRASVVPVIFSALLKLFKSGMKDAFCYLIAAAAFCLCLFTNMSNVLIVLLGAAAGLLYREGRARHDLS
jgi:chromate transporter